ncbi:A/G-specific adenine DNA glycosylase-like [Oopsacas minuta]|uniref:Adenine DNA glycosylase n=1 Tax=Oopsacas minuta TaxID=111878 RepID=A0AAV7JSV2_9METZ|nr:A/G-specific adenine DNA glycosylase-like [Oopsacas minuta]
MSKKRITKLAKSVLPRGTIHSFSKDEIDDTRVSLSAWYESNKRYMPWRNYLKSNPDATPNQHAYAVWVSEIMLQQTQVTTVIPYYIKWMNTWPSVETLSLAGDENVREIWSGLGYYNRAKNLLAGSKIVVDKYNGEIPKSSNELQLIPGIGPYTAAAISSIVFGETVGVVDGNVLRVLTRLRLIGAEVTSSRIRGVIQELVNVLVDSDNPGDFNQALMELGALMCTPTAPACSTCPLQNVCLAYSVKRDRETQGKLCEDSVRNRVVRNIQFPCTKDCNLCLEKWDDDTGVMNFPRKGKKAAMKDEYFVVCVCEIQNKYCLVKRSSDGLLALFWEFPSLSVNHTDSQTDNLEKEVLNEFLNSSVTFKDCIPEYKGNITHVFSHLSHTYSVYHTKANQVDARNAFCLENTFPDREYKWVSLGEFNTSAVSTGMKKVLKLITNKEKNRGKKRELESAVGIESKRQATLKHFLTNEI